MTHITTLPAGGSTQVEVDPISRIEGHLGVKLTVNDAGVVTEADVHGNLWRGFENFLLGRNPNDAITFVQRICGVCPVPHGTTAMFAVESVYGYNDCFQTFATGKKALSNTDGTTIDATNSKAGVPEKALHIRNLVLSAEFLMSSITHFYHLAAPSYVQGPNMAPWTPYFDNGYYHELLRSAGHGVSSGDAAAHGVLPVDDAINGFSKDLWSAVIKQYVKALRIRRLTFEAGAMFAGRMPMTSTFVAGGVTTDRSEDLSVKCTKFRDMIAEVGAFIVKEYVPLVLALGALYKPFDNVNNGTECKGYGNGNGAFLAWGGFPQTDGTLALFRGFKADYTDLGAAAPISKADVYAHLREHTAHSRYDTTSADAIAAHYPTTPAEIAAGSDPSLVNRTIPKRDNASDGKYSWLKAPRWNGVAAEVGPLARMFVMGLIKNNVAYATSCDLAAVDASYADYATYVHNTTLMDGLDPKMVSADLAVALLREGLAELHIAAGVVDANPHVVRQTVVTPGVDISIIGLPKATIVAAYNHPASYITGTVTEWIVGLKGGISTMDRLRGRAIESLYLVQKMLGAFDKASGFATMGGWIGELKTANAVPNGATYNPITMVKTLAKGFGAVEAPRGALMHFLTIDTGKIVQYQCVVPTTWNASPKDGATPQKRGTMETAMLGIPYDTVGAKFTSVTGSEVTTGGGVEAMRVAQSFDPCIACAVH